MPLEAHAQIPSYNVKALKNAFKIKRPTACRKNVYREPSGSRAQTKNITVAHHTKKYFTTLFYSINRKLVIWVHIAQTSHETATTTVVQANLILERPQWTNESHGYPQKFYNKSARCNFSHHNFPIGKVEY